MRGKVASDPDGNFGMRITPAYAGKRSGMLRRLISCKDHPRLCGEKLLPDFLFLANRGSPPPMRGKVMSVQMFLVVLGITPAYAGKRLWRFTTLFPWWDHPRLCGEKLTVKGGGFVVKGITPAYGGKSWVFNVHFYSPKDHPRLCGEKYTIKFKMP